VPLRLPLGMLRRRSARLFMALALRISADDSGLDLLALPDWFRSCQSAAGQAAVPRALRDCQAACHAFHTTELWIGAQRCVCASVDTEIFEAERIAMEEATRRRAVELRGICRKNFCRCGAKHKEPWQKQQQQAGSTTGSGMTRELVAAITAPTRNASLAARPLDDAMQVNEFLFTGNGELTESKRSPAQITSDSSEPGTAQVCSDHDFQCRGWARQGQFDGNLPCVCANCPQSCGNCSPCSWQDCNSSSCGGTQPRQRDGCRSERERRVRSDLENCAGQALELQLARQRQRELELEVHRLRRELDEKDLQACSRRLSLLGLLVPIVLASSAAIACALGRKALCSAMVGKRPSVPPATQASSTSPVQELKVPNDRVYSIRTDTRRRASSSDDTDFADTTCDMPQATGPGCEVHHTRPAKHGEDSDPRETVALQLPPRVFHGRGEQRPQAVGAQAKPSSPLLNLRGGWSSEVYLWGGQALKVGEYSPRSCHIFAGNTIVSPRGVATECVVSK